jgi:hypothetical protein
MGGQTSTVQTRDETRYPVDNPVVESPCDDPVLDVEFDEGKPKDADEDDNVLHVNFFDWSEL